MRSSVEDGEINVKFSQNLDYYALVLLSYTYMNDGQMDKP